ncbi:MAG: nusB [Sphingomonadales bacterium]|nr:nusB [Sphingomonadales bacterium]
MKIRSKSRSAARLAAVQALYQLEMEQTPLSKLLHEFHQHRLGATIGDDEYNEAEFDFFDDLVKGVDARRAEIDGHITALLSAGWTMDRLDRPMRAILRAGTYELIARFDVPVKSVINEYVDVADAFYAKREKGFVNGLLDGMARRVRPAINPPVEQPAAPDRSMVTEESVMSDTQIIPEEDMERASVAPGEDTPVAHPDQQAGQDTDIARRLKRDPSDPDAKLDRGLDESMDASDPPAAVAPGDTGEPVASSGFDAAAEEALQRSK